MKTTTLTKTIRENFTAKVFSRRVFLSRKNARLLLAVTFFFFSLILIGPFFRNNPETTQGAQSGKEAKANLVQTFFKVTYKTGRDYRVPPFYFFDFFSALCDFFSKIFLSPKGPPFHFVLF